MRTDIDIYSDNKIIMMIERVYFDEPLEKKKKKNTLIQIPKKIVSYWWKTRFVENEFQNKKCTWPHTVWIYENQTINNKNKRNDKNKLNRSCIVSHNDTQWMGK